MTGEVVDNLEFCNRIHSERIVESVDVINADLFDADGTTTAFTIEAGRTVHNILVFVNGLLMRATFGGTTRDYTVAGTTLTFTTAPANGDEIDVRYLPA